jgi:hypothetical protein
MVGYQTRLRPEALWPERVAPHQSFKFAFNFSQGRTSTITSFAI